MTSIGGKNETTGENTLVPDQDSPCKEVDTYSDENSYQNPGKVQQRIQESDRGAARKDLFENPGKRSR